MSDHEGSMERGRWQSHNRGNDGGVDVDEVVDQGVPNDEPNNRTSCAVLGSYEMRTAHTCTRDLKSIKQVRNLLRPSNMSLMPVAQKLDAMLMALPKFVEKVKLLNEKPLANGKRQRANGIVKWDAKKLELINDHFGIEMGKTQEDQVWTIMEAYF